MTPLANEHQDRRSPTSGTLRTQNRTPPAEDRSWSRTLQAGAMVAAPLAGLATTLTWPQTPLDVAARLDVLAETAGRTQLAHVLNLITILLFLPAVAGMYRLLRPRRLRIAAVGAGLVAAGLVGWSGVLALSSAELQLARTLHGGNAVAAVESLHGSPVAVAMTALFLLCTFTGLVVLAVGLWRARVVRGWVPAAVGLAVAGDLIGSTVTAVVVTVWLLLAVAFTAMALARVATPGRPD